MQTDRILIRRLFEIILRRRYHDCYGNHVTWITFVETDQCPERWPMRDLAGADGLAGWVLSGKGGAASRVFTAA
jgi:hypothetical protein